MTAHVTADVTAGAPAFTAEFAAGLDALFRWRRDVRHFRPTPVPSAQLGALLDAADLAPSVGLSQPWRFVTVAEPARRSAVRANFQRANAAALATLDLRAGDQRAGRYARLKLAGLDEAPVHLAVFALPDPAQGHGLGRRTMPETTAYSAVIAIHTLWLAARAAGLGVGWVSILEPAPLAALLDVPGEWVFVAYLCLGYPCWDDDCPELEREGWEQRRSPPGCNADRRRAGVFPARPPTSAAMPAGFVAPPACML